MLNVVMVPFFQKSVFLSMFLSLSRACFVSVVVKWFQKINFWSFFPNGDIKAVTLEEEGRIRSKALVINQTDFSSRKLWFMNVKITWKICCNLSHISELKNKEMYSRCALKVKSWCVSNQQYFVGRWECNSAVIFGAAVVQLLDRGTGKKVRKNCSFHGKACFQLDDFFLSSLMKQRFTLILHC